MTDRDLTRGWRAVAMAAALLGVVLAGASAAHAHGDSNKDYRSQVVRIEPDLPIEAEVEGGDDELRLENKGSETLWVYGYDRRDADCGTNSADAERDLYVQVRPDKVLVNRNNKAYYQNQGRYGAAVPNDLKESQLDWKQEVDGTGQYRFHDHRIHWMLKTPPGNIDTSSSSVQKVNTWKIPIRYGDQQACIIGRLDYIGGGSTAMGVLEWGAMGAAILVMGLLIVMAIRQRRRRKGRPGTGD